MATVTKSGTWKSVQADGSNTVLTIVIQATNPDPPPPTVDEDFAIIVPDGRMTTVAASGRTGDAMEVDYDTTDPTTATRVKRS